MNVEPPWLKLLTVAGGLQAELARIFTLKVIDLPDTAMPATVFAVTYTSFTKVQKPVRRFEASGSAAGRAHYICFIAISIGELLLRCRAHDSCELFLVDRGTPCKIDIAQLRQLGSGRNGRIYM